MNAVFLVACSAVLALYVSRFLVTYFLDRSGVHPRSISGFKNSLDVAREIEECENGIGFERSAVKEKFLILDNFLDMVEFREGIEGVEDTPHVSSELGRRISHYSEHLGRLDREIEGAMALQKDKGEALAVAEASSEGAGGRGPLLIRGAHIIFMVLLGLLVIALLFAG